MPDVDYAFAARRLYWLNFVLGIAGTALIWRLHGEPSGVGFAIGSAASLINLWIWHGVADRVGGAKTRRSSAATALYAGRFLALFAFGYVIVRALNVEPLAAIFGLLTSSFAVIAEILIELVTSWRLTR